jgi:hypothetical protein
VEKARQYSAIAGIVCTCLLASLAACDRPQPTREDEAPTAETPALDGARPADQPGWAFTPPASATSAATLVYGASDAGPAGASFACVEGAPFVDVVLNRGDSSDRVVTLTSSGVSSTIPMLLNQDVRLLTGQLPTDDPVLNRFLASGALTYQVEAGEAQYAARTDVDLAAITAFAEACGLSGR